MNVRWIATRDFQKVAWLHHLWNPGLYETLYRYDGLRSSDLNQRRVRCWLTDGPARTQGYAIARHKDDTLTFEELWASSIGVPSPRLSLLSSDRDLLETTRDLVTRAGRRAKHVVVRFPSDNAFGTLLARTFNWNFDTTLLLAAGPPSSQPRPELGPGLSIRPFRAGDEREYSRLHLASFGQRVTPREYRSWVIKKKCDAFTALSDGRAVGLLVAEPRRGGQTGDFNLAIEERYRDRGLGTALMIEGLRAFYKRKVPRVVIDYWASNGRAVQFYKQFGLRVERAYHFFRAK